MYKKFITLSVLIALLTIVLISCSKEEDNTLANPTNGKTTAEFNPYVTYGTMKDQDGNVYKTVTIGTQTWMAENLRTTKYNDGTDVPLVTDNTAWVNLSTGAYCNYDNTNNIDTIATYGRLYNWYAVNTGKLAPKGWHVPTDAEWKTLVDYLGGEDVAGGKLKEVGLTHWNSPNTAATNEPGFTALPGGVRYFDGGFYYFGNNGFWWSATEYNTDYAWPLDMSYNYSYVNNDDNDDKEAGFSIRCLKD